MRDLGLVRGRRSTWRCCGHRRIGITCGKGRMPASAWTEGYMRRFARSITSGTKKGRAGLRPATRTGCILAIARRFGENDVVACKIIAPDGKYDDERAGTWPDAAELAAADQGRI